MKRADALLIYAEPIPPIDPNLEDVIKSEKGTDISAVDSDDAAHIVPCDKGNPAGTESTDANLSSLDEEQEAKAERKRIRQERRERKRLAAQSVDSFDWLAPPPVHVAALNSKIKARKSTQDEDEEESKEELVIKEELCDIDVLPDEEEERLKEERRCHRQEKRERKRARREARGKSEEGG